MQKDNNTALVKVSLLILFICASIYLVRFSPAGQYFTAEQLRLILAAADFQAPLLFIFIYAAGVCLFGAFLVVFAVLAIAEVSAPRRQLTTSKSRRWFANLTIIALNPLSVALVYPALPVGVALLASEKGGGCT